MAHLRPLADHLGFKDASKMLRETLTKEKSTDDKLSQLAKLELSHEAQSAGR
ncbi:protein of unknown function (plasmid) [Caballeronia sp. S22]